MTQNNQTYVKLPERSDSNSTPSIIGSDVTIVGNITTAGELQLDGSIDGDLVCGSLVMGEESKSSGTIKSDAVVIRGAVKGEVRARSVRLESTAIIEGDIYHETLAVESGARLTGQFCYTSASGTVPPAKVETKEESKADAKSDAKADTKDDAKDDAKDSAKPADGNQAKAKPSYMSGSNKAAE